MTLPVEDSLAIQRLINLYGHIIDDRQFSRLGELFSDDAVFDLTGFDGSRFEGLESISRMMCESTRHPLGHHATNIVIIESEEPIVVLSKGIGVGNGGRVGSVTYRDMVVSTPAGWRICSRHCELRQADNIPAIS